MKPFVALLAILLLPGCSFFAPTATVRVTLPPGIQTAKGRPSLDQMDEFAVLARGNVSNSLSKTDVGRRSLGCTQLEGQIFFPLTLDAIKSGLTLSVPPGTYRFSVLGFSGSSVPNPATVAQMVSGSPGLAEYLIAQGEGNTASHSSASLAAAYQNGATPNLFAACPPEDYDLYFGTFTFAGLHQYRLSAGSWSSDSILLNHDTDAASLYVDLDGISQFVHSVASSGLNIYYSNGTHAILEERIISAASSVGHESSVARSNSGGLSALVNRDVGGGLGEGDIFVRNGSSWYVGTSLFNATGGGYRQPHLIFGPNNGAVAALTTDTIPSQIVLRHRPPQGSWSPALSVNAVGPQSCLASGVNHAKTQLDADGFAHVLFNCSDTGNYLGYGTNRSGSWAFKVIGSSAAAINGINFNIDPTGRMHGVYETTGAIFYTYGAVMDSIWSQPLGIYNMGNPIYHVQMTALGPQEVHIVLNEYLSGGSRNLKYLTNHGGSWVNSPIATVPTIVSLAEGMYAR